MVLDEHASEISELRKAYRRGDLTLYLGAGVSVANGFHTWDRLVLAMYFAALRPQELGGWRPFSNYLYAIAEWHLKRAHEPLEITARRLKKYYHDGERFNGGKFLENLRRTLYGAHLDTSSPFFKPQGGRTLRDANSTLDAVARLCEGSEVGAKGVRSVITYNYDELLEKALGEYPFQSFWKMADAEAGRLPIYHVHGFVPARKDGGSAPEEIVFTEEQYHTAAHDAYSWSNLVQIQGMAGSVGLMVGLSLSDRNMRRLLDAIVKLPHHPKHYALLQKPQWHEPSNDDLDAIHAQAIEYRRRFERSGVKGAGAKGDEWRAQIRGILAQVRQHDAEQQTYVLNRLGIEPIWYADHEDIKTVAEEILTG
jgi:hypothetical protein